MNGFGPLESEATYSNKWATTAALLYLMFACAVLITIFLNL